MSQLQDLTRRLTAAGYASHPEGKGAYLLYTDDGSLLSKHWTGDRFGAEELVAQSVRPGSGASILATLDHILIIGISSSSAVTAFEYDEDEEDWMQDQALAKHKVHGEGRLTASYNVDGRVCIVFQNASGELVCLEESVESGVGSEGEASWIVTPLKDAYKPALGTPVSTVIDESGLHIFYISAADQCAHHLHKTDVWKDAAILDVTAGSLKNMIVVKNEKAGFDAYVLTQDNAVQHMSGGGEKRELGKVGKDGGLVPSTTAECALSIFGLFNVSFNVHFHVQRRRKMICYY